MTSRAAVTRSSLLTRSSISNSRGRVRYSHRSLRHGTNTTRTPLSANSNIASISAAPTMNGRPGEMSPISPSHVRRVISSAPVQAVCISAPTLEGELRNRNLVIDTDGAHVLVA